MAKSGRAGLTSQSNGDGKRSRESGRAGLTEKSRNKFVADSRKAARVEFTDAIKNHDGEDITYPKATHVVTDKMFRHGKPLGKRDQWSPEDQARIAVAEKRSAEAIRNGEPGHYGIVASVEREAREANGDCNEQGTWTVFRRWFGYGSNEPGHSPDECHSNDGFGGVVERRQTDADREDDSHLTPGQRLLKEHGAQQQKDSTMRAIGNWFTGDDPTDEPAKIAEDLPEESSGGGFWGLLDRMNR